MQNKETEIEIEPKEKKDIFSACEAMLFAAGEPVTAAKMAAILDVSEREIKETLDSSGDRFTGGVVLIKLGNAYQLTTREEYGDEVREVLGIKKNGAISKSSMESLAIIAYNQPTTKAYVEKVRGVDSSYAFGFLMSRELIEQCGRLDAPGRPILYRTTPDFLRVFGLTSLDDLPHVETDEDIMGEQLTLEISDKTSQTGNEEVSGEEDIAEADGKENETAEASGQAGENEPKQNTETE